MGCGSSQEIYIEAIDVPETEAGYPPPKPPREKKERVFDPKDCADIEAKAKQAPASLAATYQLLINYIVNDARNGIQKVRAIYIWLSQQQIYTVKFPATVKDAHSPLGYMKTIQQGNGSYTSFFTVLCRQAGIPCVIIKGVGKAASYEVGDQDTDNMSSSWTAVFVDGSWRLIHIFWALVCLEGFNKGQWTKVEQSGKAVRQKEQASKGTTVYTQDDFWFLTDPEEFIYFCRANNTEWQLLKFGWTMEKYLNVPHFSQNYFISGFTLSSQHAAILKSENGKSDITFQHSETIDADLDYTLLFDEANSKESIPSSLQLDRFVIQHGDQKEKSLRVRFPVKGIYKVKVSGKTKFKALLASFRLVCEDVMKDVQPYPINPTIGFGYSKVAEDMGLSKPSVVKGIMVVRQGETVKFRFRCKAKLDIQTLLVHKDKKPEDLSSYVVQDRSDDDVTVTVTIPDHAQNPEYALQVNVRQEGSAGEYNNVVNYLLTHDRNETSEPDKEQEDDNESDEDRILRKELVEATASKDIKRLEKAIRAFEAASLSDEGDLTRAKMVLVSLHKEALRAAINKRDIKELEEAIEAAKASSVEPQLRDCEVMTEAEHLKNLLRRLRLYLHKILELKQTTVSEIHSYQRPKPLVHEVMKVTYLLLGEREKQLEKWGYVQALLRKQGRASIIRRISEFDTVNLNMTTVNRAENRLIHVNKDMVRQTSAGAGTFYVWSYNIITEGKVVKKEKQQQRQYA